MENESAPNKDFWDTKFWPTVGWVAWIVVAFFLGNIVVALPLAILISMGVAGEDLLSDTATSTIVNAVVYFVILLIAIWPWWLKNRRKKSKEKSGEKISPSGREKKWKSLAEVVGLSRWPRLDDLKKFLTYVPLYYVVLLVASVVLTAVLTMMLGDQTATEILNEEQEIGFAKTGQSLWQLILIGFSLVIVAPVAEEMLTRGFLFGRLRKRLSFWPVAIIVSLVFAVAHWHVAAGFMTFILSMFACRMREKTGTIWSAIWLHMLVNAISFTLLYVVGVS